MFKLITNWLAAKKAKDDKELYERGYDWAAGNLLRGITLEEVESHIESSMNFNDYNSFDRGAEHAIEMLGQIGFKFTRAY